MKLFVVVVAVVLSVFVLGASQLPGCEGGRAVVAVVVVCFCFGAGGGPVSFGVVLSCSAGNGGESASGGRRGASQLWSLV